MKKVVGLSLIFALLCATPLALAAQDKTAAVEYSGNVVMVNKDNSSITIQKGTQKFQIFYTDKTMVTNRNKKGGTIGDVKEGARVICLVDPKQTDKLVATRIDVRAPSTK